MPSEMARKGGASADDVEQFLRSTPGFLREHPELYAALEPPLRIYGERIADHMAALLSAERAHAAEMTKRADSILQSGRAAAGLAARVQEAVVALIRAPGVADCITFEFPALLAIDAASLCMESHCSGARPMTPGAVDDLLRGRSVVYRRGCAADVAIHGEAAMLAGCEALVRIPGTGPTAMLALLARNGDVLDQKQGLGALAFLGRAISAALGR